ncbi:trna ligase, partial [Kickxella alabastrina]
LTVKENGCLILASGINDGKDLLVTSKHSIDVPHSKTGSAWMDKHLKEAGKTREEFAAFLHENNATAVFELCDDEFEEHILEYPERMRGLYLHGINRNSVELETWPSSEVAKVTEEYGFRRTDYFVFESVAEGREFASKVRKDQMLDGRAIEGFVVRCRTNNDTSPFMFKIKYDEPYLMFREWREVTGRILAGKPWKSKYELTMHYVAWVKTQIKKDPEAFENFKSKGIIGARKKFLEYHQSLDGRSPAEVLEEPEFMKVLLMPVATIGCGKTTLSLALSKLFGCGHIQSDDVRTKKKPSLAFNAAVVGELDTHSVVIADRNNHIPMLRESLTTAVRNDWPGCRVVALYWSHENASKAVILKKTIGRVVNRAEKHQALTPAKVPSFRKVMDGFVHSMVPLDTDSEADCLVQDVIELDPLADAMKNLQVTIDALCRMFSDLFKRPSDSDIKEALESALEYVPAARERPQQTQLATNQRKDKKQNKVAADKPKERQPKLPAFIGLVPTHLNAIKWFKDQLASNSGDDWALCRDMVANDLGGNHQHHITVAHVASVKDERKKAIYDGYISLFKDEKLAHDLLVTCKVDYVVCDGRIMALRVSSIKVLDTAGLPECLIAGDNGRLAVTNLIPHVTLCRDGKTKPVMANKLLQEVFGPDNADEPITRPQGWAVIPVKTAFNAVLHKFVN